MRLIQGKKKYSRNSENLKAEDFNSHYVAISNDPKYEASMMKQTLDSQTLVTDEQEVTRRSDKIYTIQQKEVTAYPHDCYMYNSLPQPKPT